MLKIGNFTLKSNLILAPLAGVSDLPFRLLNRKFGCKFAFVEMLNVRSLSYKSRKTKQMLHFDELDTPLGVQLLAHEEKYMLQALEVLSRYRFELLDFNAACPERKVTKRGEGASLLKEPKKLHALLKLLVSQMKVPVTVKIRAGWDTQSLNARDVALYAQDAGVKAVFIHGRTKEQGYAGKVDYTVIKQVKDALKIPVIASGDVLSAELAKRMVDETGCDGLLVARGAFGNPWIFKEIEEYFKTKVVPQRPDKNQIVDTMLTHLQSNIDFYDERMGVVIFRKFFSWYTKGMRSVRRLRERACDATTKAQMITVIEEIRRKSRYEMILGA